MTIKVRHELTWTEKKDIYRPEPRSSWWPALEFERYPRDPHSGTGPAAYFRGEKLPADDLMAIDIHIVFDENMKLKINFFRKNKYITEEEAYAAIVRYVEQQGGREVDPYPPGAAQRKSLSRPSSMLSGQGRAEILSKFPPLHLVYMRSSVLQYKCRDKRDSNPEPYRLSQPAQPNSKSVRK